MASSSRKYICPQCYQTARSTSSKAHLVCGYCDIPMEYVPPSPFLRRRPDDVPPEPSLDDLNRGLDS